MEDKSMKKEKRYFLDWSNATLSAALICIPIIALTVIFSILRYSYLITNYGSDLETYSEDAYRYLDDIASNVILEDKGIDEAAIPKDVVKYDIHYENSKFIFNYYLDNNKGKKYAVSASMSITLSENFKILSKTPNYSSEEEYVENITFLLRCSAILFSFTISLIGWTAIILIALLISYLHKKRDMKQAVSK